MALWPFNAMIEAAGQNGRKIKIGFSIGFLKDSAEGIKKCTADLCEQSELI